MPLIAPTEHDLQKHDIGRVSSLPEKYGCDILWPRWDVGIQRKTVADLIQSVDDGRLQRELPQGEGLAATILLIEGQMKWTLDGELLGKGFGQTWTLTQHRGLMWSVRERGWWVDHTSGLNDTVAYIKALGRWLKKDKHHALVRRPGPKNVWGTKKSEDWQRHLLMGFEGIGPELAGRIVRHFGDVPLAWDVGMEELCEVEGIGKKTAERLMEALHE